MWWDDARIERSVTRSFVCSHLLPDEIARLDRQLAFGDGLTNETYWDWIDSKAKKIFLILVDIGVPDQIFGIVDDSWGDDDLPIALDQVERLALTAERDEKSERKFYHRQFYYLLTPLQKWHHQVYLDEEVVPLDVVERRQGSSQNQAVEKVILPDQPGKVFARRRIPLGTGPGCMPVEAFLREINRIKKSQNVHVVSYWASYVQQNHGYILTTPASDFNLKSFLTTTPTSVKNLEKQERRRLILNWILCLVDTLCAIHSTGKSHGNIRPSTILVNNQNHIFYSDHSGLEEALSGADKAGFDKEAYDYAAPEQWFRPSASVAGAVARKVTLASLSASDQQATAFSISRSGFNEQNYSLSSSAPNTHHHPQAADIFSLGCIILELLGVLMKRSAQSFARSRAARHKTAGRGGAVLDSSFHKNLGALEGWMTGLARDAAAKTRRKKDKADPAYRGVAPLLHVVERMLALHPAERPAAHEVQARVYQVLTERCGVTEPHCVHQYGPVVGVGEYVPRSPRQTSPRQTMASGQTRAPTMTGGGSRRVPSPRMTTAASALEVLEGRPVAGWEEERAMLEYKKQGGGGSGHNPRLSWSDSSSNNSGGGGGGGKGGGVRSVPFREKGRAQWNAPVYAV